jgi:hypothetical protein
MLVLPASYLNLIVNELAEVAPRQTTRLRIFHFFSWENGSTGGSPECRDAL